eukprot:comp16400_c0_seq1/m.14298 comp16400_c0_seq1/g.14298  ORF comp16400_c0_seq1/g.14298 comp16400_c0_seq1/m.14298 type:complete len:455 (-) comp16400_c0_seq1:62-1426(-)
MVPTIPQPSFRGKNGGVNKPSLAKGAAILFALIVCYFVLKTHVTVVISPMDSYTRASAMTLVDTSSGRIVMFQPEVKIAPKPVAPATVTENNQLAAPQVETEKAVESKQKEEQEVITPPPVAEEPPKQKGRLFRPDGSLGLNIPEFKTMQERESWCSSHLDNQGLEVVTIRASDFHPEFRMAIYREDDIVSDHIRGQSSWEQNESRDLFTAHPKPRHMDGKIFIDIGANVGWFTLIALAKGYRVLAFEPGPANLRLIEYSVCLNPHFADQLTLYQYGLSEEDKTCYIISGDINIGDGHTVCSEEEKNAFLTHKQYVYRVRAESRFVRLDDILYGKDAKFTELPPVGLMKIDIEGHEQFALSKAGADRLFRDKNKRPPIIMAEMYNCQNGNCNGDKPFADLMFGRGYQATSLPFQRNPRGKGPVYRSFGDVASHNPVPTNIVFLDPDQVDVGKYV